MEVFAGYTSEMDAVHSHSFLTIPWSCQIKDDPVGILFEPNRNGGFSPDDIRAVVQIDLEAVMPDINAVPPLKMSLSLKWKQDDKQGNKEQEDAFPGNHNEGVSRRNLEIFQGLSPF